MDFVRPTPEEAEAGLRAIKVILSSDGVLNPIERQMMNASQRHLLGTTLDLDALAPITPEALGAAVTRPAVREQLAGAFVLHSIASGEAGPAQLEAVEAFSAGLGVRAREVDDLRLYAQQRYAMLRFDVLRHMYIGEEIGRIWRDEGALGLLRTLGGFAGKRSEPALAARYVALGALPEGTLGRAYFHHCRDNGFPLPGEPHAGPELMARHDLAHVLGGYGTDPDGELQVAAFTAGFRESQSLSILLFVLCQFDLGVQTAPVADPEIGLLKPDLFLAALARGARCTVDLIGDWDYWAVVDQPVQALRERYGITP
ncbi:MAG: hypothetical protein H6741_01435 [Alphaproteobacteria bacterium]|nr:hypothetical protein [Alphaproteobacteria bacterium]